MTTFIAWGIALLFQARVVYPVIWSFVSKRVVNSIEDRARNEKTMLPWYLRRFKEGRVRIHMDGTMDCSDLSADARGHLMSTLQSALGYTMGANAVFSTEVLRLVLQCTAGRVLRAKLIEEDERAQQKSDEEASDGMGGLFRVRRRIKRSISTLER